MSKDQRRNRSVFSPVRALGECTCTPALKQSKQKSIRQNPINEKCALCVNEPSSCALMGNNCQRTTKWTETECARRQGVGRNSTRLFSCDYQLSTLLLKLGIKTPIPCWQSRDSDEAQNSDERKKESNKQLWQRHYLCWMLIAGVQSIT